MSKRILDETTASTFASDDYVYMDGSTNGSRKITPDNLVANTTTASNLTQHISDANDAIADIQTDIATNVEAISTNTSAIGTLSDLDTTEQGSLVGAVNELKSDLDNLTVSGALSDLTDTTISSPTDGQALLYDSASSMWVNGDTSEPTDDQVASAVSDWLDEHPEATTTVEDESITLAKLASDVTEAIEATDLTYKWNAVGYMRAHVRDFQGWAQNVVYDSDLGCAVGIINSGTGSHTNSQPWYRVTIDNNGYMSSYEEVVVYDTDGTTVFTPDNGYMGTVQKLSDGTYLCVDYDQNIYTSSDYLASLTLLQTGSFTTATDGSMFSLTELSNGRLIMGHGGNINGFWYSDDSGNTWTSVIPTVSSSNIGQQTYPEGNYKPFEPCFIECGNGNVIAYARKSNNAMTSATSGYTQQEPAVYSVSTDYGTSWTAWQNSSVITDMTACNGKAVIIDDTVHFVYGSRYANTDANFKLFYTYASLDDAYADTWETPVVIDTGHWDESTASNAHDCGYPSLWTDENDNLYTVYYDSDGTGTAYGANWRLCLGAPVARHPAVYNGGSGSVNVAYSQKAIDTKYATLLSQINALWLAIGETPEDTGDYDGTSPIYDSLVAWFDVTNTNKWSDGVLTSMIGSVTAKGKASSSAGAYISTTNSQPTAYDNGFSDVAGLFFQSCISDLTGTVTEFTLEFVNYITDNGNMLFLKANTTENASASNNANVYCKTNNISGYKNSLPYHFVGVFTEGSIDWYVNGTLYATDSTSVALSDILASYPFLSAPNTSNGSAMSDVRLYSRALTTDEIYNNYLYTQNETDYSTAPDFTS